MLHSFKPLPPGWNQLPEGWFSVGDAEVYAQLLASIPESRTVVEVGCHLGRSLCAVASVIRDKKHMVHAVDPWTEEQLGPEHPWSGKRDRKRDFIANCERFGLCRVTAHQMTSVEAPGLLGSATLVFLDGLHDYESVLADIRAWQPHIVYGGILCGHDYTPGWPGVERAVREVFGLKARTYAPHSTIWSVTL